MRSSSLRKINYQIVKGYKENISAYYYVNEVTIRLLSKDFNYMSFWKRKATKTKDQLFSGNRAEGEMKG